ncbi:NAD-dependent epimerase/dehydratase family protein [Dactylosporangium sp. AC04546]|uniref:NAD-dependent epimerase/dehydratase family protein n=1 Tax=Dactylosporangium sp. AC04546 TaxID=2862460 RepID=UPI001EDFEBED|nr:NAD-dependent epimerase/dehydratase family protein [Dactylosporangium sp. AC04546]WVK80721.1 NAD-dependent epimerase/dehydratase family protein [Dactylosporangium sp. AC04546]
MEARTALLVGGSGPTGPHVAAGLAARGYAVTLLHRGTHEAPELDGYEHVHADPHFREPLDEALAGRSFDVVVATYGRLRLVADALVGRCGDLVAVSGLPVYAGYHEPGRLQPHGMPVLAREDMADVGRAEPVEETTGEGFARKVRATEQYVMALHAEGAFRASLFRYPTIYGPRQVYPREWSVVRRVRDGRDRIIVPDAGLTITTRCAAVNAAAHLLAAVDRPEAAAGEIFNVGDRDQFTVRQWVEICAAAAGGALQPVSMPFELAGPGRGLFPISHDAHLLVNTHKAADRLGYVEPVPAARALVETVRWYLDHPPDEGAAGNLVDAFDYAEEDRVVEAYRRATAGLLAEQPPAVVAAHPYAHPKVAGRSDHRDR